MAKTSKKRPVSPDSVAEPKSIRSGKSTLDPVNRLLDRLRSAIQRRKYKQKELRKLTSIPASTLSRFLDGGDLSLHWVVKLASELKLGLALVSRTRQLRYYPSRMTKHGVDLLLPKLQKARRRIQILTSDPGSLFETYLGAIKQAVREAGRENRTLRVTILASHPDSPFLKHRAERLQEAGYKKDYRSELRKTLDDIFRDFRGMPSCELRVYKTPAMQLWHRIDGRIYVSFPSESRRSRHNCLISIPVRAKNAKETFLRHFDAIPTTPYSPDETPLSLE